MNFQEHILHNEALSRNQFSLPILDLSYIFCNVGDLFKNLKNKNIFIAGGTGIVGRWLLEALIFADMELDLGLHITVLTRNPERFLSNSPYLFNHPKIKVIVGDIASFKLSAEKDFAYAVQGAADVVDALNPQYTLSTCIEGTGNFLDQLSKRGAQHILYISSGAVYGKTPPEIANIPEFFVGPLDFRSTDAAYAEGKRCAELLCSFFSESAGIKISVARCFAMVGPHLPLDKHFAIGNFIKSALENKPILIKGDGSPIRSYLYLADVILRLLIIMLDGDSFTYNIGSQHAISIKDLALVVAKTVNPTVNIEVAGKTMHGEHSNTYVPCTNFFDETWKLPPPIFLEEAIRRTADWYRLKHD